MDTEKVYEQFRVFAGLSPKEFTQWQPLCQSAADKLTARMRQDADPDDLRLLMAAAGEAYWRFALLSQPGTVKIGDISINMPQSSQAQAAKLRDSLFADAAPLLTDYGCAVLHPVHI